MKVKRKYSCLIARWLKDLGYTHCFFLPGGGCMHLIDSFRNEFECIPVVHEISAGIAAEHFNEGTTGKKAFALVTTGPGLTNIVTAAASCFTEHRELLIIAGQVKSTDLASEGVRQLGVQEVNGKELFRPISVASECLDRCIHETEFKRIVSLSSAPHPGPVLIEVCLDIQGALVEVDLFSDTSRKTYSDQMSVRKSEELPCEFVEAVRLLKQAERPLFLIGGLVSRTTAWDLLDEIFQAGVPVATTTSAIDRIPSDFDLYAGRPSTWGGQRAANLILAQADLVVAFGAQLDLQQTGFNVDNYAPNAQIIQIFPSDAELRKVGPPRRIGINMDPNNALRETLVLYGKGYCQDWVGYVQNIRKRFKSFEDANKEPTNGINPFLFLNNLSEALNSDDVIALSSSGIAFTAALQMYQIKRYQTASVSCAFASMGYGLATAIGLSIANPKQRVVLVEGDGSFSQNLQELAIVRRRNLNIRFFLFDNGGYASIRATQRKFFNGEYVGCDETTGLGFPDWEVLFQAYGIPCAKLINGDESVESLRSKLNHAVGPAAFIVDIDPDGRSWPLVRTVMGADGKLSSAPLFDMAPRITEDERHLYGKFIKNDLWIN